MKKLYDENEIGPLTLQEQIKEKANEEVTVLKQRIKDLLEQKLQVLSNREEKKAALEEKIAVLKEELIEKETHSGSSVSEIRKEVCLS